MHHIGDECVRASSNLCETDEDGEVFEIFAHPSYHVSDNPRIRDADLGSLAAPMLVELSVERCRGTNVSHVGGVMAYRIE